MAQSQRLSRRQIVTYIDNIGHPILCTCVVIIRAFEIPVCFPFYTLQDKISGLINTFDMRTCRTSECRLRDWNTMYLQDPFHTSAQSGPLVITSSVMDVNTTAEQGL